MTMYTEAQTAERRSAAEVAEAERRQRREAAATADGQGEIAGLLSELTRETTLLMHQEVALVRAEMNEKVSQVERGVASLSGGAAAVYAGLLFLTTSAFLALGLVLSLWLSALLVGASLVVMGGLLLAKGRSDMRAANLKPERSIESGRDMARAATHPREEVQRAERR